MQTEQSKCCLPCIDSNEIHIQHRRRMCSARGGASALCSARGGASRSVLREGRSLGSVTGGASALCLGIGGAYVTSPPPLYGWNAQLLTWEEPRLHCSKLSQSKSPVQAGGSHAVLTRHKHAASNGESCLTGSLPTPPLHRAAWI